MPRTSDTAQRSTATSNNSRGSSQYLFLIIGIPAVAFILAAAPALQARGFKLPLVDIMNGTVGLLLQTIPFILLGVMVSAAVETWVSADFIERHFPRSTVAGFAVALIAGLCMPVCDCVIVPTFARLVRRKLPLPCAVTFLCAVPVMNPIAVWSTWFAFSDKPQMVVARLLLGLLVALTVGLSFLIFPVSYEPMRPESTAVTVESNTLSMHSFDCEHCKTNSPTHTRKSLFPQLSLYARNIHNDFMRLMPIILLGIIIAASIRISLGSNPASKLNVTTILSSIAVLMVVAYVSSLCSTSDAVIARSLAGSFPTASLLGFLIFGPMLDIKNTLMLISECKPRFTIRLALTITLVCFTAAYLAHWCIGASL